MERPTLGRLARLHGIQASYTDGCGLRRRAAPESVRALLQALGAPLATAGPGDLAEAIAARSREAWRRAVEPVLVAWSGCRADFLIRAPETTGRVLARCLLQLEDGRTRSWTVRPGDAPAVESATVDGTRRVAWRLSLPERLPDGYHVLGVEFGSRTCRALVIAAPRRAHDSGERSWGVFLPLHALQSADSWGVGDFTDLDALAEWLISQGGRSVALLPLLAAFLGEEPFEPSPYLPVSRLFWNELYVDPRRLPEFQRCEPAQRLVASASFRRRVQDLRAAPLVDYREAMALRRSVLELLARSLDDRRDQRQTAFREWVECHPLAREYAAFRAAGERRGLTGPTGRRPAMRVAAARAYHLYAQWAAAGQVAQLVGWSGAGGGLHLDIPVGVHPAGFDARRHPTLFAGGAALGAPPDPLFASGQDWSAPPPHPEAAREEGYAYFRASLAHQMAPAATVRLDHVMGLHRLFWIPRGGDPSDGAYVHYPSDELYAIVCLESHRHRTRVVGENLGTVPRYVNAALSRHGLAKLHVAQFGIDPAAADSLGHVPRRAFACVNTHDTPTFAGFLEGRDIDERVERGVLEASGAERERRRRQAEVEALRGAVRRDSGTGAEARPRRAASDLDVLWAWLERLARSAAGVVVVNLEDLWLEPRPQNVPGTGPERPNWRRRAAHNVEAFSRLPGVKEALGRLARHRP